ncbi:hypothetical protein O9K51_08076 [Purpureocillium lavendulum]|uniref:Uncharacterized protein n=1 Tax=Purpureocillium lavendulum TaxID=1247861 RepID=A0AB34FLZ6_9HYPO|nr:hypothetical protein O9K51_08076 [Purpureocillium lavendulum]
MSPTLEECGTEEYCNLAGIGRAIEYSSTEECLAAFEPRPAALRAWVQKPDTAWKCNDEKMFRVENCGTEIYCNIFSNHRTTSWENQERRKYNNEKECLAAFEARPAELRAWVQKPDTAWKCTDEKMFKVENCGTAIYCHIFSNQRTTSWENQERRKYKNEQECLAAFEPECI